MVRIAPFAVEQWMDEYETTPGVLNIAETCSASVSLDELMALESRDDGAAKSSCSSLPINTSTTLAYGAIRGSEALRKNVAALYQHKGVDVETETGTSPSPSPSPDHVLITQGAIGANFLLMYALIQPGDHVVCVYPTYQQLYSVPRSLGADVSLWELKKENGFVPDVSELKGLVKPNTKMIILNNPNNPTGAPIPTPVLASIVAFARTRDMIIFSDEVYRPLFHNLFDNSNESSPLPSLSSPTIPPPITAFNYPNVLSTGSMSKSYALAGLRLGWVVTTSKPLLARLAAARDYTTISVSGLDDAVASYALSPTVVDPLLRRNVGLARTNVALLAEFVDKYAEVCSWVKPVAGTTAFVRFMGKQKASGGGGREPVDDVEFCLDVLRETKVFFVPGSRCFGDGEGDFGGYVRIGYVCHTDVLNEALEKLGRYVEVKLL